MLPWRADLAGRIEEGIVDSATAAGERARRPARAAALGLPAAGLRRRPPSATPASTSSRGTPATWRCGPTAPRSASRSSRPRTGLRRRRRAAVHRRLRRRVDGVRRLAVRRLAGHRPVPLLPLRRGGAVGRRALPHDPGPGVARDQRQVQRRVRRDDHADAAAGPVRGVRHPRRRHALRALLHAGLRRPRPATCAAYDGDIWRWWDDFRSRPAFTKEEDESLLTALGCAAASRPTPTAGRCCRSTRAAGSCWTRCGSAGWPGTRSGWSTATRTRCEPAGDLDRCRRRRRILPRPGRAGLPGRAGRIGVADAAVRFELFAGTHASIDYRYPMALAWLAERLAR